MNSIIWRFSLEAALEKLRKPSRKAWESKDLDILDFIRYVSFFFVTSSLGSFYIFQDPLLNVS